MDEEDLIDFGTQPRPYTGVILGENYEKGEEKKEENVNEKDKREKKRKEEERKKRKWEEKGKKKGKNQSKIGRIKAKRAQKEPNNDMSRERKTSSLEKGG
jgi:hypothetical protein